MKKIIIFIIVIVAAGLGWYYLTQMNQAGETDQAAVQAAPTNDTTTTQEKTMAVEPVVTVTSSSDLGSFLVAKNGMTLYLYTKDASGVSNCYDACATNWPPYTVGEGENLSGGDGVIGQLSTIVRKDGSLQLAYKGVPLYFWKNDAKPGDTTGQNVNKVWFVVKP